MADKVLFVCLILVQVILVCSLDNDIIGKDPEEHMNTSQLITSKGYPCEEYDVHTRDGYILTIQRIPGGKADDKIGTPKPVVLVQHGLLSCSAAFVENLANESLGFVLADAGYDVWLANSRGNTYARRHEKLTPKQKEFWAFSWDEMAEFDLPATVDKVLEISNAKQLYFVGHSQGGTVGYAQLSRDQELAKKIKLFVALGPAVYIGATISPIRRVVPMANDIAFLFDLFGHGQALPNTKLLSWFSAAVCSTKIPANLCSNFLFVLCGYDAQEMNKTRIPVYVGQHPAGTSVQNVIHFAQMIKTAKFQKFDFGEKENKIKYNQTTPPDYHPIDVKVPVAMFTGTADWLVVPSDANHLINETSNIVFNKVIQGWEHLDFMWAMDGPLQCYDDMVTLFKKYDSI